MQMTMSIYIFGLAVGQAVYGPLSDKFGRRPTLMYGLVLYTITGVAASFATEVHGLIALRLFQALGGCAGQVIGRAMVRESAQTQEAARRLAPMNLMVVLGPGAAPLVGGALASFLGWRSIFYALSLLGIVNVIFAWTMLPESTAGGAPPRTRDLLGNYGWLLASPAFLGYALGGGCATTSMYAFISASPFIFAHQLHRPDYEIGLYPAILMAGVWVGSIAATRFIPRVRIDHLAVWANLGSVVALFVLLGVVLSGHLTVILVMAPMLVFGIGAGIASPAALTQAISVNPTVVGSASGLYGFSQMGVGAICTALAGLGGNPALSAALVLAAAGVVAQLSFWAALRFGRLPSQ
jgi:DHA1 family bicyclomycin/chloramphenicol resistance-like MFS transporter